MPVFPVMVARNKEHVAGIPRKRYLVQQYSFACFPVVRAWVWHSAWVHVISKKDERRRRHSRIHMLTNQGRKLTRLFSAGIADQDDLIGHRIALSKTLNNTCKK